ncbi:GNAT family N-acetyltransferase [Salmonella enterica subsp. enterica]|nr:GNAT family N-acetyltransferase [Salmonella enterica]EBQ9479964.1 N-acetyltransferase [Salmonella enterica subsp. enterica serovar Kokomlemle]ECS5198537.1 GNAT family N-acetyltransferase [Salmonella enterica subsp. enterica serovar Poano]EBJ7122029.1 GNAT family N-acetyltransferase [Salmonella enterica]ECX4750924.1 GNAT family N-acetyltransferase [Salmonella enterica]
MGLIIRPVSRDDLPQLIALCAEHADYENLHYSRDGQQQRLQVALFGEPARLFIWVVADDDQLLYGYLSATIDYSTWSAASYVYMDCLFLKAELRRQGLGHQLLTTLTAFASERQCREIQWQTPPDNQIGIDFYQRIGAVSLSKKRFTLQKGQGLWKA